jgi:DhnA family fructose-bisphosphate aldolase class Ia
MRAILLAALFLIQTTALVYAAPPVGRFPLGKPINEPGLAACLDAEAAVTVVKLESQAEPESARKAFESFAQSRRCGFAAGIVVTYTRQVFRAERADGAVFVVYDGTVGLGADKIKIYVPMEGLLHETVEA